MSKRSRSAERQRESKKRKRGKSPKNGRSKSPKRNSKSQRRKLAAKKTSSKDKRKRSKSPRKRVQKRKKRQDPPLKKKCSKSSEKTEVINPPKKLQLQISGEKKIILKEKNFRMWDEDGKKSDDLVAKVLVERGWADRGEPIKNGTEDHPHSIYKAKKKGTLTKEQNLIWGMDDDGIAFAGYSENHLISVIPNSWKALSKIHMQQMFNKYAWFPRCFTLPKEKQDMINYIESVEGETYWICKPKDSYGGRGMTVYKEHTQSFDENLITRKCPFVVQEYMKDPYLMKGKYKFHIRAYLVISHIKPLKAHLLKDAQIEFCTQDFDLTQIEDDFNKYCHISNYSVNNRKTNIENVVKDKPGIGIGTEWAISQFFEYMNKEEPERFSEEKFWSQLCEMGKHVAEEICNSHFVQDSLDQVRLNNHFQIFGLDVLMNDQLETFITEANCTPGLDWTDPVLKNGIYNKSYELANEVSKNVVHDTLTLIGADDIKTYKKGFFKLQ